MKKTIIFNDKKLGIRDVINIGIFSALYVAVFFLVGMIFGMNPVGFPLLTTFAAVPSGVIFILLLTRVPKRWTIFINTVVLAVIFLLTGHWWPMCLIMLVGGFITDLVYAAGNTRSFRWMGFVYILFTLSIAAAAYAPLIFFTEIYTSLMDPTAYGMPDNYFDTALHLYGGPLILVMILLNSIGALCGALLGRLLLRKHFRKAGLV